MASRAAVGCLAALVAVQRVRLLLAQDAVVTARAGEEEARAAEVDASQASTDAHEAWQECLGRASLLPELARALAAELLLRDREEIGAAERTRLAAGLHERRRDDWRLSDARSQAAVEAHHAARRAERRRREERALAAASERAGHRWSRP